MPSWLKRAQHFGGREWCGRLTKFGSRDGKVARDPDLCFGMSAGVMRNATMVDERSDSTAIFTAHGCMDRKDVFLVGSLNEGN